MTTKWYHVGAITIIVSLIACFTFSNPDAAFRSSDGKWADSELQVKGRNFEVIVENFERYELQCRARNSMLLRSTPEHWFNVFAWYSYWTDPKWRIPYSNAHSEIDDYYPPASARNCYNDSSSEEIIQRAHLNAGRYVSRLNSHSR